MSSSVLNTVPNDIGMTVCCCMTVSFTRWWASTLSRVGSCTTDRRVGDDRGDVLEVDGVDVGRLAADAERAEVERLVRLDDAVDVLALVRVVGGRRRAPARAARAGGIARARACCAPAPAAARHLALARRQRRCRFRSWRSRPAPCLLRLSLRLGHGCYEDFGARTRGRRGGRRRPRFRRAASMRLISATSASGRQGLVTKASQPACRAPSA